jgi:hypothetical protein
MKKTPRMTLTVSPEGDTVYGLVDGDFDVSLLGGEAYARRVSDVEYDRLQKGWVVYNRVTERLIGKTFKTRSEAIEYEKQYMNRRIRSVARWAGASK